MTDDTPRDPLAALLKDLASVGDEHAELCGRAYFVIRDARPSGDEALRPWSPDLDECPNCGYSDPDWGQRAALAAPVSPSPTPSFALTADGTWHHLQINGDTVYVDGVAYAPVARESGS